VSEKTPGQAAYEALHQSIGRRQPRHMWVVWESVDEINDGIPGESLRADMEAAAQAAIDWQRAEDVNPTAGDYDHAAEILKFRELLGEIGVMAANAPEDGDSFAVLEQIAMRIAAAGLPS
jgi:predicted ArsR family transcriptional regulator